MECYHPLGKVINAGLVRMQSTSNELQIFAGDDMAAGPIARVPTTKLGSFKVRLLP
jgi:hypothetical protein